MYYLKQSYSTIVAVKEENKIKVKGWYSRTTAIHINEFLRQNGVSKLNKKTNGRTNFNSIVMERVYDKISFYLFGGKNLGTNIFR